jgi:hypothetical protein
MHRSTDQLVGAGETSLVSLAAAGALASPAGPKRGAGLASVHGDSVQASGECERYLIVVIVKGRASIQAHVERLVSCKRKWERARYRAIRSLLAIHRKCAAASSSYRSTFGRHLPVEYDRVLTRRQCGRAFPLRSLDSEQIQCEDGFAFPEVGGPNWQNGHPG